MRFPPSPSSSALSSARHVAEPRLTFRSSCAGAACLVCPSFTRPRLVPLSRSLLLVFAKISVVQTPLSDTASCR